MNADTITYRRAELYEQVWGEPTRTVVRKYRIFYAWLARACRNLLRLSRDAGTGPRSGQVLAAIFLVTATSCDSTPTDPKVLPPADLPRPAYSEPIWSPDGLRLGFNHRPLDSIYVDQDGRHVYVFRNSLSGFWMVDSGGANQLRVLSIPLGDPAWSPDGAWIAYSGSGDIWKVRTDVMGLDSTNTQRLTFQGVYLGPAWNPSSNWLLFYRSSGAAAGIYRLPSGGGGPELIGASGWMSPNWSADSMKIAFILSTGTTYGIGCADAGGGSPQLLRSGLITPQYPKWSPDGTRIAFSDRSSSTQLTHLWIIDADGTNLRMATPDAIGSGFSWSPDGAELAYIRLNLGDFTLTNGTVWIVNAQNGALRQLTYNGPEQP